jgi:DNA-binding NarL/FixJ family response regulator
MARVNTRSGMRILLADDHAPFRERLRHVLDRQSDLRVVAEAETGAEAIRVAGLLRSDNLDLVLMDIDLPDISGIDATCAITAADPTLPVVMLTISTLDQDLFDALRSGAVGFLNKNFGSAALVRALRDFHDHGALPMSRQMAAKALSYLQADGRHWDAPADETTLSPREREVLAMIAKGLRDREIAEVLGVAETTVKSHVRHILDKLHVRNRAAAAARFRGLLEPQRPLTPEPTSA